MCFWCAHGYICINSDNVFVDESHLEKGRLVIPLTTYPALDNTVFIPSCGPEDLGGFFEKLTVDQLFPSVPLTKKTNKY